MTAATQGTTAAQDEQRYSFERRLIGPQFQKPRGYSLYVYLLIDQNADSDKRESALRAYACGISGPGAAGSGTRVVFLAPVKRTTASSADVLDRNTLLRLLVSNNYGYDEDRADSLLLTVTGWSHQTIRTGGIYLVELDQQIDESPTQKAVWELSGLAADEIGNWILEERSKIARGWNGNTAGIKRAHPSWLAVADAIGELAGRALSLVLPAHAQTLCRVDREWRGDESAGSAEGRK